MIDWYPWLWKCNFRYMILIYTSFDLDISKYLVVFWLFDWTALFDVIKNLHSRGWYSLHLHGVNINNFESTPHCHQPLRRLLHLAPVFAFPQQLKFSFKKCITECVVYIFIYLVTNYEADWSSFMWEIRSGRTRPLLTSELSTLKCHHAIADPFLAELGRGCVKKKSQSYLFLT